jgi:hypothetical protein
MLRRPSCKKKYSALESHAQRILGAQAETVIEGVADVLPLAVGTPA